jgi:hypothetical protein
VCCFALKVCSQTCIPPALPHAAALQVGKFAAAEQLNLQHSQDPTAFAAAAPVTMPQIHESNEATKAWQQQLVVPRVLARIANMQLLTQVGHALLNLVGQLLAWVFDISVSTISMVSHLGACSWCNGGILCRSAATNASLDCRGILSCISAVEFGRLD